MQTVKHAAVIQRVGTECQDIALQYAGVFHRTGMHQQRITGQPFTCGIRGEGIRRNRGTAITLNQTAVTDGFSIQSDTFRRQRTAIIQRGGIYRRPLFRHQAPLVFN